MITLSSFYVMAYPTFIISQCFQGENDECTLKNSATSLFPSPMGDPKPYDLLSLGAEQLKRAMTFVQPQAVTVEVTPEILEHLKLRARASAAGAPSL